MVGAVNGISPGLHPSLGPEALSRFSKAAAWWIEHGAHWVDLPWVVPARFMLATRPTDIQVRDVATPYGFLVASGEQAFLWLDEQKRLDAHTWIGWSPCFRDEPVLDELHQYAFIKLELYRPLGPNDSSAEALTHFVDLAQKGFEVLSGITPQKRAVSDNQIDLEIKGIEVGSYGIRPHPTLIGRTYVYGTALAEPRLSKALNNP